MLVKLDHFPYRLEHKQYLSCHHPGKSTWLTGKPPASMGNTSTETTCPQHICCGLFFHLRNPTSLSARIMSDAKSKASASFVWREAGKPCCNGNGFLGLPREISKNHTPLKLNMVPEKWWLEVRKLLSFLERQILRGYAKLPGSTMTWEWITNKTTSANWHFLFGKWEDSTGLGTVLEAWTFRST